MLVRISQWKNREQRTKWRSPLGKQSMEKTASKRRRNRDFNDNNKEGKKNGISRNGIGRNGMSCNGWDTIEWVVTRGWTCLKRKEVKGGVVESDGKVDDAEE